MCARVVAHEEEDTCVRVSSLMGPLTYANRCTHSYPHPGAAATHYASAVLGATRDESLKALLDVRREGEKREGARVY
jgi:hypothetical protein